MVILIDQPLRATLFKLDIAGQMANWALELIELDLIFRPWPSIKAQVLVDFITEYTILNEELVEVDVDTIANEYLEN